MKYLFVLNAHAGAADHHAKLSAKLQILRDAHNIDYALHSTASMEEAQQLIRSSCSAGGEVRIIACGGDGTLSGVVNAAAEFPCASVGVMPIGTGNDFVRNFDNRAVFLDPLAQLDGTETRIDLLRCNERLCVNMLNIGFDCEAAGQAARLRRNRWMGEKLAYVSGVAITLARKPGVCLRASIDAAEAQEHRLLLIAIANGAFCGGGFRAAPRSSLNDGRMDICMVENISRTRFVSLVKSYHDGTYLEKKAAQGLINYSQCETLELQFTQMQNICVDGELFAADRLSVKVLPRALRLVLPRGVMWREESRNDAACPV